VPTVYSLRELVGPARQQSCCRGDKSRLIDLSHDGADNCTKHLSKHSIHYTNSNAFPDGQQLRDLAQTKENSPYRDKFPELVVGDGGQLPWVIEYGVDFPVDATYTLHVRYGSPEPRPMDVWLDNRRVGQCCGRVTGNAPPYPDRHPPHERPRLAKDFHGVEWEEACKLPAAKGKHTLKFTRKGLPPRVSTLRLESPVAFPKDWRPKKREVKLSRIPPTLRRIFLPPGSVNVATLRLAVGDMIAEFGPRYPNRPRYLKVHRA